jgi:hypothetical protein
MQDVLNRQSDVTELIDDVNSFWVYDLLSRKPSPAEYDDSGKLIKTTNLDLSTFLYALVDRGAVINLPEYKSRRPKSITEGTIVTSSENRHGKIIGLVSNREVFSFGLRILDMNVMSTDKSGFPRCFLLTDFDGSWYDGWKKIDFIATSEENKFLFENKLLTGNMIYFNNFVTPEKWVSLYGQYYLLTKALIDRMTDEMRYLRSQKFSLIERGLVSSQQVGSDYPSTTKLPGKKIKVQAFEVEVDLPEPEGQYEIYSQSLEGFKIICDKIDKIREALERFRFATRCVEYAASKQKYMETFPAWITNVSWEKDYKTGPRSRSKWNRLKIVQPGPFQKSIALRTRWYEVTQEVAEDAEVPEAAQKASTVLG